MLIKIFAVVVICDDPGIPTHGSRSGDDFTFGKMVRYRCDPGYKITGSRRRTCTASGTWSGSQATCLGKPFIQADRHKLTLMTILAFCDSSLCFEKNTNTHVNYPLVLSYNLFLINIMFPFFLSFEKKQ